MVKKDNCIKRKQQIRAMPMRSGMASPPPPPFRRTTHDSQGCERPQASRRFASSPAAHAGHHIISKGKTVHVMGGMKSHPFGFLLAALAFVSQPRMSSAGASEPLRTRRIRHAVLSASGRTCQSSKHYQEEIFHRSDSIRAAIRHDLANRIGRKAVTGADQAIRMQPVSAIKAVTT